MLIFVVLSQIPHKTLFIDVLQGFEISAYGWKLNFIIVVPLYRIIFSILQKKRPSSRLPRIVCSEVNVWA
jgi:hypothetical protein